MSIKDNKMKELRLDDKNIVVTGADGFLGRALCDRLRFYGANVIAIDINPKSSSTYKLDISNSDAISNFVSTEPFSGLEIHGLVNNAAISFMGGVNSTEEFDKTMAVNIRGTDSCIVEFSKSMTSGSIVNISSIFGHMSPDFRVYDADSSLHSPSVYGATKAAIAQMTRYYSIKYAPNIRVNSVSPGGIWNNHSKEFSDRYSDRVPMKRMADVEEIVGPIIFLLGPLSGYITGHNLMVDGGLAAW